MSDLKPGQRCVIIAGCPENIGLVVEVIQYLGEFEGRENAYHVRTVSGRHFHQLWSGNELKRGTADWCVTDRYKLRPLVEPDDKVDDVETAEPMPTAKRVGVPA